MPAGSSRIASRLPANNAHRRSNAVAARGGELVFRGLADQFGALLRHDDQAGLDRQDLVREIDIDREIQMIGEFPVFPPFLVGQEISEPGFYLDTD